MAPGATGFTNLPPDVKLHILLLAGALPTTLKMKELNSMQNTLLQDPQMAQRWLVARGVLKPLSWAAAKGWWQVCKAILADQVQRAARWYLTPLEHMTMIRKAREAGQLEVVRELETELQALRRASLSRWATPLCRALPGDE
jgi:hypothetical protein